MSAAAKPFKVTWWDRALSHVAPGFALRGVRTRAAFAQYEAAKTTRLRKRTRDGRAPDVVAGASAEKVRNYMRAAERDYDLFRGILRTLERNVVGENGIQIEPMPKDRDGNTLTEFADEMMLLFRDWSRRPEVTWSYDWGAMCRRAFRIKARDGEGFAQHLLGNVAGLQHGTRVPYSIELLEADLVPMDFDDERRGIRQGVERNAWGRPVAYHVYKQHPGENGVLTLQGLGTKRVSADRLSHFSFRDRLHQTRGISLFCSIVNRLEDLKDIEGAELIAARINASIAALIKRDPDATRPASAPGSDRPGFLFEHGTIWDGAAPGDDFEMVDTKRPNPNMPAFLNDQTRRIAAGSEVGHSSASRNYDGTYSAQRQELSEITSAYRVLTREFVGQFVLPAWENFIAAALASGQLKLPANLDPLTLTHADFRGPPMPWIDPKKEWEAIEIAMRVRGTSLTKVLRERGENPWEILQQIRDEREVMRNYEIPITTDGKADTSATSATAGTDNNSETNDGETQ